MYIISHVFYIHKYLYMYIFYLKKEYGMTSNGGYAKQFNDNMQRKVGKNVSIGDYFDKKANMMHSMITGEDSNDTRTQGIRK